MKVINLEMGLPLLKMIVESHCVTRENSLAKGFIKYVEDKELKTLKKDEWETVYYFFDKHDSLDSYDEMDSWPVVFDKFANDYK